MVSNFQAEDLSPTGILVSATWYLCHAPRRPPFACSRPRWIDSATSKSLKVVRFLNDGNKHEVALAE